MRCRYCNTVEIVKCAQYVEIVKQARGPDCPIDDDVFSEQGVCDELKVARASEWYKLVQIMKNRRQLERVDMRPLILLAEKYADWHTNVPRCTSARHSGMYEQAGV